MNATNLPKLRLEARKRIRRTLEEAQAQLRDAVVEWALKAKLNPTSIKGRLKDRKTLLKHSSAEHRNAAMTIYLDVMAWEYMCTRPVNDFEGLIARIGHAAKRAVNGDDAVVEARMRYWVAEARERAEIGMLDSTIPIKIDPRQVETFRELRTDFENLRSKSDFYALVDGVHANIVTDGRVPEDQRGDHRRTFNRLARRAMAALGLKFADPTRAEFYWIHLLRQESPRFGRGSTRMPHLLLASEEFFTELETRALEKSEKAPVAPRPTTPKGRPSQGEEFLNRAKWLADRLRERGWDKNDLSRQRGPDRKTVQKILDGLPVREDVLEKVAVALASKCGGQVELIEIPND
jgi:hypothetical protein